MKKVFMTQSPAHYFDVVPIFLHAARKLNFFDKFYVASDGDVSKIAADDVTTLQLSRDGGWSNNIIQLLEKVEEDVIFMGCDDHIFKHIDIETVQFCFDGVISNKEGVGCIRLTRKKRIALVHDSGVFSEIVKPYGCYVSLQPTIWRVSYLKQILRQDESAWNFEKRGSDRAMRIPKPYACCSRHILVNYYNFIKKGGLFRPAYQVYAKEAGIKLDETKFYDSYKIADKSGKWDYESIHGKV